MKFKLEFFNLLLLLLLLLLLFHSSCILSNSVPFAIVLTGCLRDLGLRDSYVCQDFV